MWGRAILTGKDTTNPVFVSVGHKISMETATELTLAVSHNRVPEPVRQVRHCQRGGLGWGTTSGGEVGWVGVGWGGVGWGTTSGVEWSGVGWGTTSGVGWGGVLPVGWGTVCVSVGTCRRT